MTTGFLELNKTGRVTRVVMSGTSSKSSRSCAMTSSSVSCGLAVFSNSTLKRAECSPSSERFMLLVSNPYITSSVSILLSSFSLESRIFSSTSPSNLTVSSSGVPTGIDTSNVNSLWCTSGKSSVSNWRPTEYVTQKQPAARRIMAIGLSSAQRIRGRYNPLPAALASSDGSPMIFENCLPNTEPIAVMNR